MNKKLIVKIVIVLHLLASCLISINILMSDNITIEKIGKLILINIFLYMHYLLDIYLIKTTYKKYLYIKKGKTW